MLHVSSTYAFLQTSQLYSRKSRLKKWGKFSLFWDYLALFALFIKRVYPYYIEVREISSEKGRRAIIALDEGFRSVRLDSHCNGGKGTKNGSLKYDPFTIHKRRVRSLPGCGSKGMGPSERKRRVTRRPSTCLVSIQRFESWKAGPEGGYFLAFPRRAQWSEHY